MKKISLEKRTLLLPIFCLFFIAISGVSASDVLDMSNDSGNNDLVSGSIDSMSDESVGSTNTNQLSNEKVSSSSLESEDNSHEMTFDDLKSNSSSNISSSSSTAKTNTTTKVSKTTVHSGNPIYVTLKDRMVNH